MIRNYLKITFRSLWKNKVFVIINVLGLGIAIACCIVAYLNYNFGRGFDADQLDVSDVYRIDMVRPMDNREQLYGYSPIPVGAAAAGNIGKIDDLLRVRPDYTNFRIEDETFGANIAYTDPSVFDFFRFDILSGDPASLEDPKSIFISDKMAATYFPEGNALGQTFTRNTPDGPEDHIITGIFRKKPLNSSFADWELIANVEVYLGQEKGRENDWKQWITTFIKVGSPSDLADIQQELDSKYVEVQNAARIDFQISGYYLEPFQGMPARADSGIVYGHWFERGMPNSAIVVPAIMAILILLIACFNFTNTSMAIAGKRLKEIGLRKVMGGMRRQLIIQFMLENFFLCATAMVIGLIIAFFLVPAYSAMWPFLDIRLDFTENPRFYLFLLFVLFATGILAGSYPAFYVSKFQPAAILRSNLKYGGTSVFTNILLGAQFTISLIAIMFGVIFYQNARYQESLDVGFDTAETISVRFNTADEVKVFKNRVENDPLLLSVAGSEYQINGAYRNDPIISADQEHDVDIFHVGDDYFETVGYELIEGRNFRPGSQTDMQESVIISEKMAERFGWDEPIGQKLVWMDTVQLYVIGVMKNVYTDGFWVEIQPLMLRYVPETDYRYLTARFEAGNAREVNEYLRSEWHALFPDQSYTGYFLNESFADSALINYNILVMFASLGLIATFLSVMGLFSLVSLTIIKRMKEIGVRKVLGASISSIISLINRNYLIILSIAALLAATGSYFMANGLMDSIWVHHVTPGVFSFGLAVIAIFIMAFSTIGFKVFRAASANPTETIRME